MPTKEVVEKIGGLIDLAGVLVIAVGVAIASIVFIYRYWRTRQLVDAYRPYRQGFGRAILLGLEETVGPLDVEHQGDERAEVTAQVRPIWWSAQTSLSGTAHPWRFETRRDASGWRVWAANLRNGAVYTSGQMPAVEQVSHRWPEPASALVTYCGIRCGA